MQYAIGAGSASVAPSCLAGRHFVGDSGHLRSTGNLDEQCRHSHPDTLRASHSGGYRPRNRHQHPGRIRKDSNLAALRGKTRFSKNKAVKRAGFACSLTSTTFKSIALHLAGCSRGFLSGCASTLPMIAHGMTRLTQPNWIVRKLFNFASGKILGALGTGFPKGRSSLLATRTEMSWG